MKANEIRELIDFIAKSELDEVNIETGDLKISVKRNSNIVKVAETNVTQPTITASTPVINSTTPVEATTKPIESKADESSYVTIKSPMIGTFYRASNPDTPPFINIGDSIKAGQPVCIIEAMKLFNEIEADISGKIVKVLVDDASPVEYDQPLFLVDPS